MPHKHPQCSLVNKKCKSVMTSLLTCSCFYRGGITGTCGLFDREVCACGHALTVMFTLYAPMWMCTGKNMCIEHVCVGKGVEDGLV